MEVIVTDDAEDDLIAGYRFYESQETGTGKYFSSCNS